MRPVINEKIHNQNSHSQSFYSTFWKRKKMCPAAVATVERLHGMIHGTLCRCCCVDNIFYVCLFVCLLFFFLLWINCMRVTHCNAEWKNSETIWRNCTKMRTAPAITIAQTSMWLVCLAYNFIDIILAWFQAAARILILAIYGSGCIFSVADERHEQTH